MRPRGRILCLTSNFPRWPGDSTTPFVLHLAQDLQNLGWQVTALAPHAQGAKTREILDGVEVRRFRYLAPAALETVCYQGGALINLRRHRANYLKLPALIIAEYLHTALLLRQGGFDLVHSHWLLPQGLIGTFAAGPLRIPHVCTVHGGDVFGLRAGIYQRCKAFAIRRCQAVTVNSSVTRQAVAALCPDYAGLHTVPMGVAARDAARLPDREAVTAIHRRYRRGSGPLLVFTGRLVEEKGLGDLLAALPLVRAAGREATLVVIGEGQGRQDFEGLAGHLGIGEAVFFAGWLEQAGIDAFLEAADIFVAPSKTSPEGWVEAQGLTIVEAMMAGRPVIASRSGGIVDSITDGESGLLVNEACPGELAHAILRLANDPGLGARLGATARTVALAKFSRESSAMAFSSLFERLIDKPCPTACSSPT